jgi:predicted nucleotidyltransferase
MRMEKKKLIPKISKETKPVKINFKKEEDIALDFATKVYKQLGDPIKAVVLFGSEAKKTQKLGSDIDVIILLDDVSVDWDLELTSWYREELNKIVQINQYSKTLHINTIKLSTWWEDLMRGDPVIINILRYGKSLIDVGGFFEPLKALLLSGKIKGTPESIYNALERAPMHLSRSKFAELSAVEGIYWSMVDSAHAALIANKVIPPSPEHITMELHSTFVDAKRLNKKYVDWYRDVLVLHKKISHREISDLRGVILDDLQDKAQKFLDEMIRLVKESIE